ncbi:DNA polymerase delta subunit 4-like [Mizuhopecten yessoensis]|uniref:DNA polymerase delta subunit 4 n=1 Tax=Mizuhopecten yessoensis TaxID=6573 RepID=A0A210QWJ2_MIZYE|nr:DNA polymerase delta subunit 4-like [Mizuhopecten yessoensis]OWF53108.1 DNA polymerase delta subunit 4 [Mizuhopecten yessoensis]
MSSSKYISDTFKYVKRPLANQVFQRSEHGPIPSSSKADANVPINLHGKSEKDFLREFDMNLEFGPCIGISRLERWERAQKHGLEPPLEVKELLTRHQDDPRYTQCVWNDYVI